MREIEIKVRISDKAATLATLVAHGVTMSEPLKQHDVVYSRPGAIDNDPNECWLRIRTENDTVHTFTLKRSVTSQQDSIEHEVVFDNPSEMRGIIAQLGYELFSDLTKIRQKGKQGDYEWCVDEVPELGTFVEVEKLCEESADINAVREELWALLETLGISREDEETDGYDVLMRQKFGAPSAPAA